MNDVRHVTDTEAQLLLADALDAPARTRVEHHLAACPDCQATVLSFEALSEALSALPVAEPPFDFTAGVMARVDALDRARAADRRAAFAILGVSGLLLAAAVLAAGPAGWASALSAASSAGVAMLQVLRVGSDVLSPIVSALRVPLVLGSAALAIPLVFALTRLAQPRPQLAA